MKFFATLSLILTAFLGAAQNSPCDSANKKTTAAFPADTTITLENGTSITFNRCDFFEVRNCVSFKEIRTAEDAGQLALPRRITRAMYCSAAACLYSS